MKERWEQQTDETTDWYDRFALYLYMGSGYVGSGRTIAAAHALATRLAKGAVHPQLASWRRAARRYQWQARAAAFDAELGCRVLAKVGQPPVSAGVQPAGTQVEAQAVTQAMTAPPSNEERLRMVAELLHQVYGVLRHADLLTLSKEEARQLLPTLRLFFRDLLHFYQSEAARLDAEGAAGTGLNMDDFVKFMTEMNGLRVAMHDLGRVVDAPASEERWRPLRDVLAQLYPDETSARRMAGQAQLDSARIHFSARAVDSWHAILTEAAHAGLLEAVIDAAQQEYGANKALAKAVRQLRQTDLQLQSVEDVENKPRHRRSKL